MTLLKRLFGDLFGQSSETEMKEETLLKEKIVLTQFFLEEYRQWLQADMHFGLIDHLKAQREILENRPDADPNYFQFRSAASNGFYFHGEEPWSNKDYSFLVQYFTEKLIELGYRLNNSSREVVQQQDKLLSSESFYFKLPLASRNKKPIPQYWGNILLEHKLVDERTNYVKLMAHIYSDRNYETAYDFIDLENELVSY